MRFVDAFWIVACLSTCVVAGCGASAETDEDPSTSTSPNGEPSTADSGFATERWGIGTSWYNYDSSTHAVTPRSVVYAVVDEEAHFFEIESYYDERGTSGYFTLVDGSGSLRLESSVKEAPVCAAFGPLREVDCGSQPDLFMTTMRRPLPDAGFAVQNPGIWVVPRADRAVFEIDSDSIDAIPADWSAEASEVASVARVVSSSRIHDTSGTHLTIDGDLQMTAWILADRTIEGRCAAADYDNATPLADAASVSIDLPSDEGSYAVTICDETVEPTERPNGLWPSATFDLLVEVDADSNARFVLHPGLLHWRYSPDNDLDSASSADVWSGYES